MGLFDLRFLQWVFLTGAIVPWLSLAFSILSGVLIPWQDGFSAVENRFPNRIMVQLDHNAGEAFHTNTEPSWFNESEILLIPDFDVIVVSQVVGEEMIIEELERPFREYLVFAVFSLVCFGMFMLIRGTLKKDAKT